MRNQISEQIKQNGRSNEAVISNKSQQNEQLTTEQVNKVKWNFEFDDLLIFNRITEVDSL